MSGTQFGRVAYADIGPPGEEGVRLEGLRITFRVEKTTKREPNKHDLRVFNLSEATRARVSRSGNRCFLYAGYRRAGGALLIAVGDVTRVKNQRQGVDRETQIELGDGAGAYRESVASISVSSGGQSGTAIEQLARTTGLPLRDLQDIGGEAFANGFSYVGPTREGLTRVLGAVGADWSIQDGEIQVVRRGRDNGDDAILLSPDSGLIGVPENLDEQDGKLDGAKGAPGYRIRALLQPRLKPGGVVRVESEDVEAFLRISSLTHRGDTHSGDFVTEIEGTVQE